MFNINFETVANLALIYNYDATLKDELKYSDVLDYVIAINKFLSKGREDSYDFDFDNLNCIYFSLIDKEGITYLKLNSNVDEMRKYIMYLPLEVIAAAQQADILKNIGLSFEEGRIVKFYSDKKNVRIRN